MNYELNYDWLIYVWIALLLVCNGIFVLMQCFYLPGNWMMVIATLLFAWGFNQRAVFGMPLLWTIVLLAIVAEVVEFLAGAGAAKKFGAGWLASLAAIAGAILGAIIGTFIIPIPILGTLLGCCGGAGLAVFAVERMTGKEKQKSIQSGVGAGIGVAIGTILKIAIGGLIWLLIAIAAFWP